MPALRQADLRPLHAFRIGRIPLSRVPGTQVLRAVLSSFGAIGRRAGDSRPVGSRRHERWRLVTGGFLHGGLLHLVFNMFLLWMLGQQLEQLHGPVRYVGLYLGSLAAGSLGVMLLAPMSLTVGASGAVFGLMAATVVHQMRRGVNPWHTGLGGLVVVNLVFTFGRPGISIGGHLGGLVGGALLAWLLDSSDRRRFRPIVGTSVLYGLLVAFLAAGVWTAGQWMDPLLG